MGMDTLGTAGRRVAKPGVGPEARHHAIVDEKPVLVADQAIAALPRGDRRWAPGVDHVEEATRIRAPDQDLPQRRGVEQADTLAHGGDLALGGRVAALAGARIAVGPAPEAHRLPRRVQLLVPRMEGCPAHRLEQAAARRTGNRPEGQRRPGRAERGRPDLRNRFSQSMRKDSQIR